MMPGPAANLAPTMSAKTRRDRFEAFTLGVELMVVDRESLLPKHLVPVLLRDPQGVPCHEVARGTLRWCAGRAAHLIQIRSARPVRSHAVMHKRLAAEVRRLNEHLGRHQAMLLPGGAHPWADPVRDTTLMAIPGAHAHEGHGALGQVFALDSHGWRNAPGTVLGIPFSGDHGFSRIHAAARLVLPLLPALAASSPFLMGQRTGFQDSRLEALLHVSEEHPELLGPLVPEAIFTQEDYDRSVLGPIAQALGRAGAPHVLDPEVANLRGAVPRFDTEVLELRMADPQECPKADLAIAEFTMAVLNALTSGRWVSTYLQRAWPESDLLAIALQVMKDGDRAMIANHDLLLMFGLMKQDRLPAGKLWQHLFVELYGELSEPTREHIALVLEHGNLASRLEKRTGRAPSVDTLRSVYRTLAQCAREDQPFL